MSWYTVNFEAPRVGLFPNENLESLGEIIVEPISGQRQCAKRRYKNLKDILSSLCRRLTFSAGRSRVAFYLVVASRAVS